jgi:serine/threonine protein kinase
LKLSNQIAEGSFGKVFCGEYNFMEVAIKEIEISNDFEDLIKNEIYLMKNLRHNNLVFYLGHSLLDNKIRLVMELCKGGSLLDILQNKKLKLSVKQKLKILFDCAAGLFHLHSNNIIHRDIKSPNVLLSKKINSSEECDFTAKLTDFGMSKIVASCNLKTTMTLCGTAQWTAPEVLSEDKYGMSSDIFSFGVLIWEVFSQQIPYVNTGLNNIQVAFQVVSKNLRPDLNLLDSHTPAKVLDLIKKCWDKNPDNRPDISEILEVFSNLKKNLIE